MRKTILAASAATLLSFSGLALAAEPVTMDTVLGTTAQEVRNALVAMGYEVREIETEGRTIEAYVVGNGRRAEIYVSVASGKPTKVELE